MVSNEVAWTKGDPVIVQELQDSIEGRILHSNQGNTCIYVYTQRAILD